MSEADDDDVPELVDAPSSSDEEDLDSDTVPVHKKSGKPTAQQMKSKAEEMKMTRKAEADVLKIEGNELVSRQQYAEVRDFRRNALQHPVVSCGLETARVGRHVHLLQTQCA